MFGSPRTYIGSFVSIRFQITTFRAAKGLNLELLFPGNLRPHPKRPLWLSLYPSGGTSDVAMSAVHDETDFHLGLTL